MNTSSYFDFINAAESHYKARMDRSAVTMKVYMGNPAGVGDHAQVFDDFLTSLEAYRDARDAFEVVQQMKTQFLSQQETEEGEASEDNESED